MTDTQLELMLNGTISIELNGTVVMVSPNNQHKLKLTIINNPNATPIITTNHNIIINGDTGTIIKERLSELFTLGRRLFSDQSKGVYIYKIIEVVKKYVVKVYREEFNSSNKSFMREVRYLLKFDGTIFRHPNIVKVYYGETLKINDDNFNYYKMKYYKFGSLDHWINKFNDEKILQLIMLQLVNSVFFIQSHEIIHRDIRPANVFIDEFIDNKFPVIVLADFECATKSNFSSRKETEIIGAKLCAPEVFMEGYSFESDNYSIGLTLFELITGKCNFQDFDVEKLSSEYNLSKEFAEIVLGLLKLKTERLSLDEVIKRLLQLLSNSIKWSDHINTNNGISKLIHSNTLFEYAVIEQDFRNFQFISEKSKHDNDFKREALKRNGLIYQFFRTEEKTKIMTKLAFINNYKALEFAPEQIRGDIDLMKEFTESEPLALEYIPNSIKEYMPTIEIVKKNGLALQYASHIDQNNFEIVKRAVLQNAKALRFATTDIRKNFLERTLGINDNIVGNIINNESSSSIEQVKVKLINSYECLFPYKPYDTQIEFMNRIIDTLDSTEKSNAILESPTIVIKLVKY
ncbi:predicted protein [Naegleria gruberi]|uniref:non-specific serine/threonine protein kinase n=1 Tax=Naegleria gruberi TaxID=5762 RepID=D2W3X4_NAEGR|nr:uncharacterized protein NAEGRDRAFT_82276 [Naegleria gruberi]EFC36211.1 predicted protein [Naegleria gruberi]|eukprot:XP_002668955.1 predicted protein [Naegleria gruberi strain NEG-M]